MVMQRRTSAIIDISVEKNCGGFLAKLQGDIWELNIWLNAEEINALRDMRRADWNGRYAIKAGKSANACVFWAYLDGNVAIMVGDDDESWDFSVTISRETMNKLFVSANI
jgi:hypothetical protein